MSRELSRERTALRVRSPSSLLTSALKRPAGTVFVDTGCLKSRGMGARFGFDAGGNGSSSAPICGTGMPIALAADRSGLFSSFSSSSSSLRRGDCGTSSVFCGKNGSEPVKVKGFAETLSPLSLLTPTVLIGGLAGAEWRAGMESPGGGKRNEVIVLTPSSSSLSTSNERLDVRCLFSRPCEARTVSATIGGVGKGRDDNAFWGDWNASCGTPGGGRNVKPPGLNSGAAMLRGLPRDGARV